MVAKRKKEIQFEADTSQAKVDEYFRKNPLTGNPFKDIGGLLATRDDRNRAIAARKLLDADADKDVTMRGQDITKELGLGEIDVRKDANRVARMGHTLEFAADMGRTAAYEKGQNQQFELGKGELELNRDIFLQQAARYRKYGEPADLFALTERAANTRVGAEQAGLELSDDLLKATEKYLKPESKKINPVATQSLSPVDVKKAEPFEGYVPYPQVLEAAPLTYYGSGIIPQIGGSAVEGVKLLGRTAARISAADPLSPSYRYRRKVNR